MTKQKNQIRLFIPASSSIESLSPKAGRGGEKEEKLLIFNARQEIRFFSLFFFNERILQWVCVHGEEGGDTYIYIHTHEIPSIPPFSRNTREIRKRVRERKGKREKMTCLIGIRLRLFDYPIKRTTQFLTTKSVYFLWTMQASLKFIPRQLARALIWFRINS